MHIKIIDHSLEWDRFVINHPDAFFGHLFGWSQVISRGYGHKPVYLAVVDGGSASQEIRAVLPLFRFKRPLYPAEWISVPFLDHAGILADSREAGLFLLHKIWDRLISGGRATALCLRQDNKFDATNLLLGEKLPEIFTQKIDLALPLASDSETMIASFPSKLRSQIKKGMKNGLTWKVGEQELLPDFYRVFSRNMRDLGSPVHSRSFFKTIFLAFPDRASICMVYYQDIPAAAGLVFRFKQCLVNPWASSIREYRHLNTNMMLYWQMIRLACEMGLEIFDMGRSSKGASTYRFKKQWGPRETPLSWYSWKLEPHRAPEETLHIDSWCRLPLWGANLAGPLLRKYISL